ncbi:unnamed protein product, partial [Cylicocyclus nassatus]
MNYGLYFMLLPFGLQLRIYFVYVASTAPSRAASSNGFTTVQLCSNSLLGKIARSSTVSTANHIFSIVTN